MSTPSIDPTSVHDGSVDSGSPPSTSLSLLAGVRAREPEAWRRLAYLYSPLVYHWCRRKRLQARDAEDVVQEVFLTVAQRIADFHRDRAGDTFRGWLWTITRHKIGDWIRRQHGREQADGGTDAQRRLGEVLDPEAAEPDEPDEAGGLYQRALDLIRSEFEERSWQAFLQVAVEGQDAAEVAAALGMSRNAVYVAKSRILCRLREVLGDDEGPT